MRYLFRFITDDLSQVKEIEATETWTVLHVAKFTYVWSSIATTFNRSSLAHNPPAEKSLDSSADRGLAVGNGLMPVVLGELCAVLLDGSRPHTFVPCVVGGIAAGHLAPAAADRRGFIGVGGWTDGCALCRRLLPAPMCLS